MDVLDVFQAACAAGLSDAVARTAAETARTVPQVSFSGWLLSGKDTVALATYRRLGVPHRNLSFAAGIKAELDEVIGILRVSGDELAAAAAVSGSLGIARDQAGMLVQLVLDGTRLDDARESLQVLDAYQRTHGIRRGLQYLGSEIRRAADPSYWVRQAQRAAVLELAEGRAFVFTDARLPDEVTGLQALGAKVVRLTISRETQLTRLRDRDGLDADPAALYHSTETSLDEFDGFDLALDNERALDDVVEEIVTATRRWWPDREFPPRPPR